MSKKKKKQKDDSTELIFSKALHETAKSSKKKKKKKKKKEKGEKPKKEKSTPKLSSCKIKQIDSVPLNYKDALESEHSMFFLSPKDIETSKLNYHIVIKTTNKSLLDIVTGESITSISKKCGEKDWKDSTIFYPATCAVTNFKF